MSLKELILRKRTIHNGDTNVPKQPARDSEGRIIIPSSAFTSEGYIDPTRVEPGIISGGLGDDYVGQGGEPVRGIRIAREKQE